MTKAERATVEELQARDAVIRAMGYPQFPRPVPMPAVTYKTRDVQAGWVVNWWSIKQGRGDLVSPAWRDFLYSYSADPRGKTGYFGGCQSKIILYATEPEAYRAAAYAGVDHFSKVLAEIYAKCF